MTEGLNKKHEKKCMNRKLKGVNRTETQEKKSHEKNRKDIIENE